MCEKETEKTLRGGSIAETRFGPWAIGIEGREQRIRFLCPSVCLPASFSQAGADVRSAMGRPLWARYTTTARVPGYLGKAPVEVLYKAAK